MADKQNVGGIEVTADVKLGPLNEKLEQLTDILKTFDNRKFTVTGDLKGSFFKDLDQAIQKIAAGAKAPVQLDAAQNSAAKLQDQLNKMNNLEAKVASFEVANDAAASIQAYLDAQKFVAKISKFEIDENSLAEQIQTALTGRKFKLDVDIGEVTGTVTPGKGATAAQRAATPAAAAPAKPAAASAAATAAQAAGIDPSRIADAIAKAIAAATTGTAPAAHSAAAKTEAARGTSNTVSPTAFGLRADASPAATWAARQSIQYRGLGTQRYDQPRPFVPPGVHGFKFTKTMATQRPDIAMVLADAGVAPGEYAPKAAAFQVASILLQEQEDEAKDAVLRAIYRSAMDPFDVGGGAAGLKTMGDRVVRRGFHGRRPTPRGTGRTPQFGGGRAQLNAGTLTEPSVIGPALRTAMPTPRTAWHTGEGVQFDKEFIDRIEGLIGGQGVATGRADTPAIAQARARVAELEKQEARTTPEEETLANLRSTVSRFDTTQGLGVTGVNREANWQEARELLRPRMAKLVEDVVSAGHKPREFFAGVRRSMEGRIQEGGKIEDIGSETGPLELEAITLTQLYKDLEIAQERRTGGRISKRGGRYGVRGAPMGKFETGIVTPGWIPRDLTEADVSAERSQFRGEPSQAGDTYERKDKSKYSPAQRLSEKQQLERQKQALSKQLADIGAGTRTQVARTSAARRRLAERGITQLVAGGQLPATAPIPEPPAFLGARTPAAEVSLESGSTTDIADAKAKARGLSRFVGPLLPGPEKYRTESREWLQAVAKVERANARIERARSQAVAGVVGGKTAELEAAGESSRQEQIAAINAQIAEIDEKLKTASDVVPEPLTKEAGTERIASYTGKGGRAVARKAKSTRRKALRGLGATVAEKGVDKRPETELISARGKLFQRLFEGEAYKRVEELRNLESMTATGAVETYSQLSGQEQVDPAIEDMLRNEARKQFIAALPEDEADLYTKAQGIPMTDEEAQNWRANEVGRAARVGAEATAFDERHGRKRRTRATPAAEPTPAGTVTDINEYRAFRKKGGGIGWMGPKGFVSQKNVPAQNVASEMLRIGGAASGEGSAGIPPGAIGAGGSGGGGGRVYDVRVRNFNELNRLLTGTTQQGALGALFRKSASPLDKMDFQGTPEEAAKAFAGGDLEKLQAMLRGEVAVPAAAGKRAKRVAAPRGARAEARFEDAAFTFAQGAEPSEEIVNPPQPGYDYAFWPESPMYQPSPTFNQREEARTVRPAEARMVETRKQAEVTRARKEQDAADRAQEKAVDKLIEAGVKGMPKTSKSMKLASPEEEKPAAAGAAAKPAKAKAIDNPADDFYKAAAKAGYPIAPRTGMADRRAAAQQEIAQQYGEFNLQRQMLPERAPGVAFAQVFARLTGVKGRMEAAAEARSSAERELLTAKELRMADEGRLVSVKEYRAALGENLGAQAASMRSQGKSNQEIKTALAEQSALHKRSISEEKELVAQVAKRRDTEGEATQKLKETDTALSKAGGKMASFSQIGALFVGAKAFMLFNQALDQTIQLASDVGGRAVDQMLGFQATNDKVTKSLASQITAFHGNTLAAEGQMAVMAGLSDAGAKFIGKYVIPNAQAMAGSAANVQASDMFRAASYRGGQGGKYMGFAPGLFEGQGGVLGGQLLAEQMGGVPGVLERTVNDLSAFTSDMRTIPQLERSIAADRANLIQIGPRSAAPSQAAYDAAVAAASAANAPMEGKIAFEEQRLAAAQGAPGTRTAYVKDLNDTMRRGAVRMGDLAGSTAQLETQFKEFGTEMKDVPTDVQDAMKAAGEKLGGAAPDLLKKMIESGVGIEGLEGRSPAEQASLVGKAVQQFATGRTTPDQQQYMNIQKQQLEAQRMGLEMQRAFQTEFVMPAEVSLERLMNPPVPIAAGTAQMAAVLPGGGGGVTAQIAQIQKLQDANQAFATQAKVLRVINPEDQTAARGLLQSLTDMGTQMQALSTRSAELAGALSAAQYENQRRVMNRSLQDALALGGKRYDQEQGTLGALQRQQVMLDRQNQSLSLQAQQIGIMLSQRQINFQRAVAGFVTPGITAEERGAAIEQARIEADYAQKQLDIQKQQATIAQKSYKLNIQIFDVTVARQITDLKRELGLLDKTYITNIEIKLNEDKIKEIDKQRQVVAAQLNGYMQKGIGWQNTMISTAVSAAATISGSVADFYKTVTTMTNSYFTSVALWMQTVANGGIPTGTTRGGGGGANRTNNLKSAAGSLGTYSSPTTMLVGEAGTETVAVLRNPRTATATPMGGGGGMTVVINVSGNSIRDDRDIDLLTDRIERKLNMKASLLGFRRPV